MTFKAGLTAVALSVLLHTGLCQAAIEVTTGHNNNESATPGFVFKNVPQPSKNDAATQATFALVDGQRDRNGGNLDTLNDGKLPVEEDQPAENFFSAGADDCRLLIDLGKTIDIKQVNSYSWHPDTRGPQVYRLFASDGKIDGFNSQPRNGTDPLTCGWTSIASVDTRPQTGAGGGQYAASIADSSTIIGKYRYLLFVISTASKSGPFGNTFYSEIDVIDAAGPAAEPAGLPQGEGGKLVVEAEDGKYRITVDTVETPDLTAWVRKDLAPVIQKWYPKLVHMLPSDGYEAPTRVDIIFSASMQGVAATGGTQIQCAASWFRRERQGEAKGAIIHELVHVVQNYDMAHRTNPNATRTPDWVVEGIADYIRWFLYEPQTQGAVMTSRTLPQARYDGSYRISGNFLNWVSETYDKELVRKLNAAARTGTYTEDMWKTITGQSVQELGQEWKASLASEIAEAARHNTLTDQEKEAGWILLFDGASIEGWSNFKREDIRPGWQVRNGALSCVDPRNAGDLCTKDQFRWFELQLEYRISEGGNSGIMYHVTDQGGATWATGPEFQLEDNEKAADPVRCGWLYALYQPEPDPKTGKPLDATKPAGQWNHVRLLISPEKCEHAINQVKYFEYVLGSDDFKQRVAKSKFGTMPLFAKSGIGSIVLQGDHGQVSFRNIKIRPIQTAK